MLRRKSILSILLIVLALPILAQTQQTNIAIILDGSGSMQAFLPSGQSKLDAAKEAVEVLVQTLPTDTNASFWSYGHRLPQDDVTASCNDIEQILPLQPINAQSFISAAQNLNAIGYTPISQSLTLAAQTLPVSADVNNIIVLVSDGEETCAGDPCAVAQQLAASNVDLKVNTIGFDVDSVTRAQLQCIADVTGGRYFDAADAAGLQTAVVEASQVEVATPTPTPVPPPTAGTLSFVDGKGELIWVGYTITQAETGVVVVDSSGSKVSLEQGIYNVEYRSTVSPVITLNETITILGGDEVQLVMIRNGVIEFVDSAGDSLWVDYVVNNAETGEELFNTTGYSRELQPGIYNVTYAVPGGESTTATVTLLEGETIQLSGAANGRIEFVDSNGDSLWTDFTIVNTATGEEVISTSGPRRDVPPGEYEVTYQVDEAGEATTTTVTVLEGETIQLSALANGRIEFVDSNGDSLWTDFTIVNTATGEEVISTSGPRRDVPPGEYEVTYQVDEAGEATTTTVTVLEGETIQLSALANGRIEFVDSNGDSLWTDFTIVNTATGEEIANTSGPRRDVPPGEYEVTYQVDEAGEATTTTVTVLEGETIQLSALANGRIEFVDSNGDSLWTDFTIVNTATGEEVISTSGPRRDVPPGEYEVTYQVDEAGEATTAIVTVAENEVVQLGALANGRIEFVDSNGDSLWTDFTIVNTATGEEVISTSGPRRDVPPGEYEVTYQVDEAGEAITTIVTVAENEIVQLSALANGQIEFVDSNGDSLWTDFTIVNTATGEEVISTSGPRRDVPPGEYEVTYQVDEAGEQLVSTVLVEENGIVQLSALANGQIEFVDSAGESLWVDFSIVQTATGNEIANTSGPRRDIPPGVYRVGISAYDDSVMGELLVFAEENQMTTITVSKSGEITSDRPATEADIVLQPTPTPMPAPEADEDGFVRQWASEASGSSQYGDDNWSFQQATGAPDTDGCGDIPTAWASSSSTGQDFLTLVYDTPVFVQQIDIYQTLNPGSIVSVDISTPEGQTMTLGNSTDAPGNTECPGVFSVQVSGIDFPPVNTVTINLDQTIGGSWNEIDAVELIGTMSATTSTVSVEPTTTTDSTTTVDVTATDGASFLLTLSNGDIYNQTQAEIEILEISFQDTVQFAIRKSLLEPIVTIDIKDRLASGTYTISDDTDANASSIAIPFDVDGIPYSAIYGSNLVGQFSITIDGELATGAFQIEADRNVILNMNDFSIADIVDGAPELPDRINASGLFSNVSITVELLNG